MNIFTLTRRTLDVQDSRFRSLPCHGPTAGWLLAHGINPNDVAVARGPITRHRRSVTYPRFSLDSRGRKFPDQNREAAVELGTVYLDKRPAPWPLSLTQAHGSRRSRRASGWEDLASRVKLDGVDVDGGDIVVKMIEDQPDDMTAGILESMAIAMIKSLGDAHNYVETSVRCGRLLGRRVGGREFVMTIRRGGHPTPHQMRERAEEKLERAGQALSVALAHAKGEIETTLEDTVAELDGCQLVLDEITADSS